MCGEILIFDETTCVGPEVYEAIDGMIIGPNDVFIPTRYPTEELDLEAEDQFWKEFYEQDPDAYVEPE